MKTALEMENAAKAKGIQYWEIHKCSLCGHPIGYVFLSGDVYFDAGCFCSDEEMQLRDWEDVAYCYNLNAGASDVQARMDKYPAFKEYVQKVNALWGFDTAE